MARIENNADTIRFFSNLLWLNLRKLRGNLFWRLTLISINFIMLYSALVGFDGRILILFFLITSLANLLIMYIRTGAKSDSTSLLRSMGASRTFILADNLMEIFLEFLIAVMIALVLLPFFKTPHWLFRMIFWESGVILLFSPLFTMLLIARIERQHKRN